MSKKREPKCCNCFACVQNTEMCPLNENYDEYAYLKIEEKIKREREERKKSRLSSGVENC